MKPKFRKRRWVVPDPNDSYEEWLRFRHQDLAALDDFQLWQARREAVRALETIDEQDEAACGWWIERLRRIDAEHRTRTI